MTRDPDAPEAVAHALDGARDAALAELAVELYWVSRDGYLAFRDRLASMDREIANDVSHPLHGEDTGAGSLAALMFLQASLARVMSGDRTEQESIDLFLDAIVAGR